MDEALLAEWLPDVQELFAIYDQQYFEGCLTQRDCKLEWSDRMTKCAGLCYHKSGKCTIRLSRPLLSLRPFKDTINTLLHEMIHAYLFLKQPSYGLDRDGHGDDFKQLMQRINASCGSEITIYHTFYAEVAHHQKHVWRCQGKCQQWAPFYGWCRRSINRPPQPADWWWARHARDCGGQFVKVNSEQGAISQIGREVKVEACAMKPAKLTDTADYFAQFAGKGQRIGNIVRKEEIKKEVQELRKRSSSESSSNQENKRICINLIDSDSE